MISLIAAVAKNRVIGSDNKIPWHIPEDLKHFKEITTGKIFLIGRKTFESILGYLGKPLPNRKNIIITRQSNYQPLHYPERGEGSPVEIYSNIEIALAAHANEDIYVIGGAEIYAQTIPFADKLYITEVNQEIEGDAVFPSIDKNVWRETKREAYERYSFVEYEKT